jgi:hypothetical protein
MAGWKRLALMGLMVCLPIPMLASTGLAVPLPASVYRVAVGFAERTQAVTVRLPGFEAVVGETTHVARRGTIRLSAAELRTARASAPAPAGTKSAAEARPKRVERPTRRAALRAPAPRKLVARAVPARAVSPARAKPASETTAAAAPDTQDASRPSEAFARPDRVPEKKEDAPEPTGAAPGAGADAKPKPSEPAPRQIPPRGEPRNTPGATPPAPAPPPPPAAPPPSLPPIAVTPPIDPLPDPLPVSPKAQLEQIAADLQELVDARQADRVEQALEKVESAVDELEESPPDKQGAVGDIKNAIQKLDDALHDGEINLAERTLFVTRLNAVTALLKGGS